MTSLDTLAAAAKPRPRWQECHVAYALRILPTDRADLLRAALVNGEVRHTEIARALRVEDDLRVDSHTIGRHRLGYCTCEPSA